MILIREYLSREASLISFQGISLAYLSYPHFFAKRDTEIFPSSTEAREREREREGKLIGTDRNGYKSLLDVSILLTREERVGPPGATSEAGLTFFSTPFYPYNGNTKIISFAIHARDARLPLTRDRVDETREAGRGEEIVTARARGRDRLLLEAFSVQWLVDWLLIVEH